MKFYRKCGSKHECFCFVQTKFIEISINQILENRPIHFRQLPFKRRLHWTRTILIGRKQFQAINKIVSKANLAEQIISKNDSDRDDDLKTDNKSIKCISIQIRAIIVDIIGVVSIAFIYLAFVSVSCTIYRMNFSKYLRCMLLLFASIYRYVWQNQLKTGVSFQNGKTSLSVVAHPPYSIPCRSLIL